MIRVAVNAVNNVYCLVMIHNLQVNVKNTSL